MRNFYLGVIWAPREVIFFIETVTTYEIIGWKYKKNLAEEVG